MGYYILTRFDFVALHLQTNDAISAMNQGKSIFAQLMSLFPEYAFRQCVARYKGDRHKIKFSCRDQFMVMSFAQLTSQQSLRTNEASLTAFEQRLYHSGLSLIPRSTLSDMNEKKDWVINLKRSRIMANLLYGQISPDSSAISSLIHNE